MTLSILLARHIATATGRPTEIVSLEHTAGGSINRAVVAHAGDGRRYFVKLNDARRLAMFEAEAEGLRALAQTRAAARVPQPLCAGSAGSQAFLVLEHLDLAANDESAQERLGHRLAAQHRTTHTRFGWHRDNTIGSTPQANTWADTWIEFYRTHRLGFQLQLAVDRGEKRLRQAGDELCERLPSFFTDYRPYASLLHGDLWGGNAAATNDGEPVIFDPAVYYGDREADVAMTELFGGFCPRFYGAYRDNWPLDAGYRVRRTLYNLYHVLNHFNLFGGGYAAQAERMLQLLLSETR